MKVYGRDIQKISEDLPKAFEATMRCYDGDCAMCSTNSIVCAGAETKNYWNRSIFLLSSYHITCLQMNENDKHLLFEILKMKLSINALDSMTLYDNTNKNEATHRAISANLPKNVYFSRNMKGRLAATVHRSNNSPGTSTKMKCDRLVIELSNRTNAFLDSTDRECAYQKEYQKREEVQHRKLSQKAENLVVHKTFKDLNKANICHVYKKVNLILCWMTMPVV
ncbi:unnamed protein product [Mytilus coruscus]|uniref:Uncharacterized protein n=1 Tax=Mytilus coruscus TaxID=42192 RepID=A0A6J8A5T0_MYTCO|nr:unnamed protein product [Mytilus coruscus]